MGRGRELESTFPTHSSPSLDLFSLNKEVNWMLHGPGNQSDGIHVAMQHSQASKKRAKIAGTLFARRDQLTYVARRSLT